jgi:NADH-quinone oxidoreductase subunit M
MAGSLVWTMVLCIFWGFQAPRVLQENGFSFLERTPWLSQPLVDISFGLDSLSYLFVSLALGTLMVLIAWITWTKQKAPRLMMGMFFLLAFAVCGVFCSLDLFLFYIFWELTLVPTLIFLGRFGGGRRFSAAWKLLLMTLGSSLIMFAVVIYLGLTGSGDFFVLSQQPWSEPVAAWISSGLFLAMLVKVPLFPLHFWLPDAYEQNPGVGNVASSVLLVKMGVYGFYRWGMGLFPAEFVHMQGVLLLLALIAVYWGGLAAWIQNDLRRVLAYSSISHMGFVLLGLFAGTQASMQAAFFAAFSHSLTAFLLFLLADAIDKRLGSMDLREIQGLASVDSRMATLWMLGSLALVGLPATSGFIGEWLILGALFAEYPLIAWIAMGGLVLSVLYTLRVASRLLWGRLRLPAGTARFMPLTVREYGLGFILAIGLISLGLFPQPLLSWVSLSVDAQWNLIRAPRSEPSPVPEPAKQAPYELITGD